MFFFEKNDAIEVFLKDFVNMEVEIKMEKNLRKNGATNIGAVSQCPCLLLAARYWNNIRTRVKKKINKSMD